MRNHRASRGYGFSWLWGGGYGRFSRGFLRLRSFRGCSGVMGAFWGMFEALCKLGVLEMSCKAHVVAGSLPSRRKHAETVAKTT